MSVKPCVAVVGSVNMDICGRPAVAFTARDSNPGIVSASLGGVGANIARCLNLLGCRVRLLTAIGGDLYAEHARAQLAAEGLDLSLALEAPEARTSTYLYIVDDAGDMVAAIADMKIQERLTPRYLEGRLDALNRADAVVVDANLSDESLSFVGARVTAPIFADAVSAAKVAKLRPIFPKLRLLKLNRLEAERLTSVQIDGDSALRRAGRMLEAMGLRRVFITLGADGAAYMDEDHFERRACVPVSGIANTTGAGDAFTAALVWSELTGLEPAQALERALAAAAIALEGEQAVNSALSAALIQQKLQTLA